MRLGMVFVATALGSTAAAEPAHRGVTAAQEAPETAGWNLLYVELLGKAGPYGLGYERRITRRLSVGAAASYASVGGQKIATAAPYLHARLLGGRNALFTELGAVIARSSIPSPVPEWDGMSETGAGGFASLGWQRSWRHLVVRAQGSVMIGEGGTSPWGGVSIGYKP